MADRLGQPGQLDRDPRQRVLPGQPGLGGRPHHSTNPDAGAGDLGRRPLNPWDVIQIEDTDPRIA
ncbi:hypothetical protein NOCARDAX2BIS_420045 [Nocardioides sp. AX2bis]|nr:hypothetical protein NOCARDAX2BIS_420045 [Nocardioides sp. AX2bis]